MVNRAKTGRIWTINVVDIPFFFFFFENPVRAGRVFYLNSLHRSRNSELLGASDFAIRLNIEIGRKVGYFLLLSLACLDIKFASNDGQLNHPSFVYLKLFVFFT